MTVFEETLVDSVTTATWKLDFKEFRECRNIISKQPLSWVIFFTPNRNNTYNFRVKRFANYNLDIDEYLVVEYVAQNGVRQKKENQLVRGVPYNDIKFDELQGAPGKPSLSIKITGMHKYIWSQYQLMSNCCASIQSKRSWDDITIEDSRLNKKVYACSKYMNHWLPRFTPGEYKDCANTIFYLRILVGPNSQKLSFEVLKMIWKKYEIEAPAVALLCADTILEQWKENPDFKCTAIVEVLELVDRLRHKELMNFCLTHIANEPDKYPGLLEKIDKSRSTTAKRNLVAALRTIYCFTFNYEDPEYKLPQYPTSDPDVQTLVVGRRKFRTKPYYLASWSRVFDRKFFGRLAERGKKEIPLPGVKPKEFEMLLKLIYTKQRMFITDDSVEFLIDLADRFEMPAVTAMCGEYLCKIENAKSLTVMDRLEIAEQYKHIDLMVFCFNEISKMSQHDKENLGIDPRVQEPELWSRRTYDNILLSLTEKHNEQNLLNNAPPTKRSRPNEILTID